MAANISFLFVLPCSKKNNHFLPTDDSLFSSGQESDLEGNKENGTPAVKTNAAPKQVRSLTGGSGGGSGLFDDEDEDEDFFSGKSLKKSDSGR